MNKSRLSTRSITLVMMEMRRQYSEHMVERKSLSVLCVSLNNNLLKAAKIDNLSYDDAEFLQSYNMKLWETYRKFTHELNRVDNDFKQMLPDDSNKSWKDIINE